MRLTHCQVRCSLTNYLRNQLHEMMLSAAFQTAYCRYIMNFLKTYIMCPVKIARKTQKPELPT